MRLGDRLHSGRAGRPRPPRDLARLPRASIGSLPHRSRLQRRRPAVPAPTGLHRTVTIRSPLVNASGGDRRSVQFLYLEVISFGWLDCRLWWGSLSDWCRTSCGSCSSGLCRRRRRGLKAGAGAVTVTVRYWRRSSSSPHRAVPGSRCPRRRSGRPEQLPTGGSRSGRRPGYGPSCTVWSWTNSAGGASWTGPGALLTR